MYRSHERQFRVLERLPRFASLPFFTSLGVDFSRMSTLLLLERLSTLPAWSLVSRVVACQRVDSSVLTNICICSAPETVKVPQMAESLTEGTLRSFSYEIGDFVEQDAEIASIETVSSTEALTPEFVLTSCLAQTGQD